MIEEQRYRPEVSAAPAARRFVTALAPFSGERLQDLALLVTEAVTNAILHARTEFSVRVERRGAVLRVAVTDGSSAMPVEREFSALAPTGRGMMIISRLADRWGVEPTAEGKVVWFEMDERAA